MIKYLITLLILILINIPLWAQDNETGSSLLWRITRGDMKDTSYLFATHHLIKGSFIDSSYVVKDILLHVDDVITEIGNEPIDTPKVREMRLTDRVYTFESREDEAAVDSCVKRILGNDLANYYMLKPIVIYMTLDIFSSANAAKNFKEISKTGNNTDDYFLKNGKRLKKNIYGLETPLEQASILLDSIPFREQISMLVELCKILNSNDTNRVDAIDSCYKRLDLECLADDINSKKLGQEILVDKRNINWVQKIIHTINSKSAIIAVGALHLPGKKGLINLLREVGYSVEPMRIF
jgi:uncharacterized protein